MRFPDDEMNDPVHMWTRASTHQGIFVCPCLCVSARALTDDSHLSRELSRVCRGGERDSLLSESQQS